MNNKIKFRLGSIFCVIILSILGCNTDEKTGFIEIGKVLEDFKLRIELNNNLTNLKEVRQSILDTLELELNILSRQIDSEKAKDKISVFGAKRDHYIDRKHRYENEIDSLSRIYDQQVTVQINQYVKDFGIENNFIYIFGAEGSGALMYAIDSKNITNDVKKYINEKYLGKTR